MKKLICGPMATLSHEAFRRLVEKFGGVDEYYTEMINAPSLLQRGPFEKYYLMNETCPQKIVWQLTGHESESMARAAEVLAKLGGIGIDINMGCCAPEIVRNGAGIAWMLKPPEETLAMVRAVKAAIDGVQPIGVQQPQGVEAGGVQCVNNISQPQGVEAGGVQCVNNISQPQGVEAGGVQCVNKIPQPQGFEARRTPRLSVKLRLGAEDFTPQKFFDFCAALADCGVEQITLHPRTQKEKLTRPPRRHFVQELAALLKPKGVSVIYNGNVKDKASAQSAMQECPDAQGIMISRACVQKPWLFAELRASGVLENAKGIGGAGVQQPQGVAAAALPNGLANNQIDLMQLGLDYIADLQVYQPPEFFKTRMQRFFAYYCDNFSFAHYIKTKMLNCATPKQAEEVFRNYFNEMPGDRVVSVNSK